MRESGHAPTILTNSRHQWNTAFEQYPNRTRWQPIYEE
jgi:hypothetical protein